MVNERSVQPYLHVGSYHSNSAYTVAWMHMRDDDAVVGALRRDGRTSIRSLIEQSPTDRGHDPPRSEIYIAARHLSPYAPPTFSGWHRWQVSANACGKPTL